MSGDAVKIYFCDICNESIPLKDLELGAAIAIKGKVICERCNPQGTPRAAAPSTSFSPAPVAAAVGSGGGGLSGWVSAIALIASVAALSLNFMQREDGRNTSQTLQQSLQNSGHERDLKIEKLLGEQKAIAKELQDLAKSLRGEILGELDKERMSSENRGALLKERLDLLQESLRQTDTLRTRVEQIDAWKSGTVQTLAAIKADLESYMQELRSVKEAAAKASSGSAQPAAGIVVGGPAATPAVPVPGWEDILKRLKDADPGVRWTAILDLVATGDPRAVPYLLPLLKDTDHFVRKNAADSLGELDAKAAVGELIDALNDTEHYVRESVYTALKRITKQSIKFDPYAKTKEERDRGIAAWRDWWTANKAKLLGS